MIGDTPKTARELVDECNQLARLFYKSHGYEVPDDYRFYDARHPQELSMWNMAVLAYDHIARTDIENALSELED